LLERDLKIDVVRGRLAQQGALLSFLLKSAHFVVAVKLFKDQAQANSQRSLSLRLPIKQLPAVPPAANSALLVEQPSPTASNGGAPTRNSTGAGPSSSLVHDDGNSAVEMQTGSDSGLLAAPSRGTKRPRSKGP
jgi:hypothetical protein